MRFADQQFPGDTPPRRALARRVGRILLIRDDRALISRVAVAGDGPLLPAARALGAGAPGLVHLGRLDRLAVRRLIDASHLVALTSLGFDDQPMTVVESISAGRGVLHCDPRLTEGLDRDLLTATADRAGIADLLVRLALDAERVRRSADVARSRAAMFSPESHLAALLPLLAVDRTRAAV